MAYSFFSTGTTSEVNFIPEIFSKMLQAKFYSASILPKISNTDFEGEITGAGSKVVVRTVPAVTINDYAGSITTQELTTAKIELLIDKAKYYSFKSDDVLQAQSDIDLIEKAANDAAEGMRVAVETDVLQNVIADAGSVGADETVTSADILANILSMARTLDEKTIPEEGRFLVLSPEFVSMLKQTELKQAYLTGDDVSPIRNGLVGRVDRFDVLQSNMLHTDAGGHTHVIAGHPKAISFASQFTNTEEVRMESTFGTQVRGLKCYGVKVIVPHARVSKKWT